MLGLFKNLEKVYIFSVASYMAENTASERGVLSNLEDLDNDGTNIDEMIAKAKESNGIDQAELKVITDKFAADKENLSNDSKIEITVLLKEAMGETIISFLKANPEYDISHLERTYERKKLPGKIVVTDVRTINGMEADNNVLPYVGDTQIFSPSMMVLADKMGISYDDISQYVKEKNTSFEQASEKKNKENTENTDASAYGYAGVAPTKDQTANMVAKSGDVLTELADVAAAIPALIQKAGASIDSELITPEKDALVKISNMNYNEIDWKSVYAHDFVKGVQTMLGAEKLDGIMGSETKGLIKAFQEKNNLNADGVPGPDLAKALLEELNK